MFYNKDLTKVVISYNVFQGFFTFLMQFRYEIPKISHLKKKTNSCRENRSNMVRFHCKEVVPK